MKLTVLVTCAVALSISSICLGDCDNPPTPGPCEMLDANCNIVRDDKCFATLQHTYICGDTAGSCPPCDGSNGSCGEKTQCLVFFYNEAVPACPGAATYTPSIIPAKKTTACVNQWDYAKLLALALATGKCVVSCTACADSGGGIITSCATCWACIIAAGIGIQVTDVCDYKTDCLEDPTATPKIDYIITHVISGTCP